MDYIVKFVMVHENNQLSYEKYLNDCMARVFKNLGIIEEQVDVICIEPSEIVETEITDFYQTIIVDEVEYIIFFSFQTYNNEKQLEVVIAVEKGFEKYREDFEASLISESEAHFVERLKIELKNELLYTEDEKKKQWGKCLWLMDSQARTFSSHLYIELYETENLFREFISAVLTKVYGANWWRDIIPVDIRDDQIARERGYKAIVPSLNDVEDYLMSIDVSTLKKIVTLKFAPWKPTYDKSIEELIVYFQKNRNLKDVEEKYLSTLITKLTGQLDDAKEEKLWNKYFSTFFPATFLKDFDEFSKNRNHVAHNKVLDRNAYKEIKKSTINIKNMLLLAFKQFYINYKSVERATVEQLEDEYREQEYLEVLNEIAESEAGVCVRSADDIKDLFEEALIQLFDDISDNLRFRCDLEIIGKRCIALREGKQSFFEIVHRVTEEKITVICELHLDASDGASSVLTIEYEFGDDKKAHDIIYTNGEYEFDGEQSCYMPVTQDEFGKEAVYDIIDEITDYANSKLVDLKAKIDAISWTKSSESSTAPISTSLCSNCEEPYIYIGHDIAKHGQCLCCGEINYLYECSKCGKEVTDDFEYEEEVLCEACYDKITNTNNGDTTS